MTTTEIFKKTMPFVMLRVVAYGLVVLGFTIYAALCSLLIAVTYKISPVVGNVLLLIIIGGTFGIWRFIKSYILYMVKAGHIAVVSELIVKGQIPEGKGQVQFGKDMVKRHFLTTNAMWVLDNLVLQSVKQIKRMIDRASEFLKFIPGIKLISGVLNVFVGVFLNYSDEAIFGYIFQKNEKNAWKPAADGIVIYAQNWKELMKSAAVTSLILVGLYVAAIFSGYGIFVGLGSMDINPIIPVIVTSMVVGLFLFVKWAIVDVFVMISIMNKYLTIGINQEPSFDLYSKIKGFSSKFNKIIERAGVTNVAQPAMAAAAASPSSMQQMDVAPQAQPVAPNPMPSVEAPVVPPVPQPQPIDNPNNEQRGV